MGKEQRASDLKSVYKDGKTKPSGRSRELHRQTASRWNDRPQEFEVTFREKYTRMQWAFLFPADRSARRRHLPTHWAVPPAWNHQVIQATHLPKEPVQQGAGPRGVGEATPTGAVTTCARTSNVYLARPHM